MNSQLQYILFILDEQSYALPLAAVERVVRAVEITPLPQSPPAILGVINVHGAIVPVVNIRRRLGLPERELGLADQLVIARPHQRRVAFVVDEVRGIIEPAMRALIAAEDVFSDVTRLEGGVKTADGLVFIQNVNQLLSIKEEEWLATTL